MQKILLAKTFATKPQERDLSGATAMISQSSSSASTDPRNLIETALHGLGGGLPAELGSRAHGVIWPPQCCSGRDYCAQQELRSLLGQPPQYRLAANSS